MPLSREAVVWGFRLVLGREPESEEGIQAHMGLPDEKSLVEVLLKSPEFRASGRFGDVISVRGEAGRNPAAVRDAQCRSSLRMVVFGNCQASGTGRLLQALTGGAEVSTYETTPGFIARLKDGGFPLESVVGGADLVLVQMAGEVTQAIRQRLPKQAGKLRQFPPLAYGGFHPDCVYVTRREGGQLAGPMGEYQSSIAFWAWRQGLDVEQAIALFRPEVYEHLGFHAHHASATRTLLTWGQRCNLPMGELLDGWRRHGCFMHTINHPRLFALADVVAAVLRREGIEPMREAASAVDDQLARWPIWPVYPPLAARDGIAGSYDFKVDAGLCPPNRPVLTLSLPEFVNASFEAFSQAGRDALACERVDGEAYQGLTAFVPARASAMQRVAGRIASWLPKPEPAPPAGGSPNPYASLPDVRFWRRSVERVAPADIDPVVESGFRIGTTTRVATAGSCFAQHIARHLRQAGFNYLVADADPSLSKEEADRRQFGVFSARYGNLYTARQLVQLFDRAHGTFEPLDRAWRRADGRFVDPLRPQVEPDGFARASEVEAATQRHLAQVRQLFEQLDVFVFTLGLTEAWRRKADGTVFPLAPGVAGGSFDPSLHEFVNFDVEDVLDDLHGFEKRLRSVNPRSKLLLTVSPVPLIATYEDRHVIVSTTHSKSVLRAAAGRFAREARGVDYFPSYEIITGPASRGAYFAEDLRSIEEEGVEHVMRVFFRHYVEGAGTAIPPAASPREQGDGRADLDRLAREHDRLSDIVCDEEAIDRHRGGA